MRLGRELKTLGENRIFLTADKNQTLAYINNAPVDDTSRQQARENVKDLWNSIDVEQTTVRLEDGARQQRFELVTDPDKARDHFETYEDRGLDTAAVQEGSSSGGLGAVVESGMRSLMPDDRSDGDSTQSNDDISTQWVPYDDHQIFAYYSGKNLNGVSDQECETLRIYSDDPDYWEYDFTVPNEWLNAFEDAFYKDPARAYAHYFNPFWEVGSAPEFAEASMNDAKNATGLDRFRHTAYAIHFLSDMANPLHTASPNGALKQAAFPSVHANYEADCDQHLLQEDGITPISSNYLIFAIKWALRPDLGPSDYNDVDSSPWWHPAGKYHLHCEDVAEASTAHSEFVLNTVFNNPIDPLSNSYELRNVTKSMLRYAQKHAMGYVAKIRQ